MKNRGKRAGLASNIPAFVEEAFLAVLLAGFVVISAWTAEPVETEFLRYTMLGLLLGVIWKALSRRVGRLFLPPVLYLAFVYAPYSALGAIGRFPLSLVALAAGLGALAAFRLYSNSWIKGALAGLLLAEIVGLSLSPPVLTPNWKGDCRGPYDVLLAAGGIVSYNPGPYAVLCDNSGQTLLVTYPLKKDLVRMAPVPGIPPRSFITQDAVTALAIDGLTGETLVPFVSKSSILRIAPRANYPSPGLTMMPDRCRNLVALAHDPVRNEVLSLCADSRILKFSSFFQFGRFSKIKAIARKPSGLAINGVLRRAYVTDLFGARLRVIDLENLRVTAVPVGPCASGVAVHPDGRTLYVGRPLHSRIDVYDADSYALKKSLKAGFGVSLLQISSTGHYLFAANPFGGTITVWDLALGRRLGTYEAGRPIRDMSFCPVTERLYFTTPCSVAYLDLKLLY